jgi:hypothetical protein
MTLLSRVEIGSGRVESNSRERALRICLPANRLIWRSPLGLQACLLHHAGIAIHGSTR